MFAFVVLTRQTSWAAGLAVMITAVMSAEFPRDIETLTMSDYKEWTRFSANWSDSAGLGAFIGVNQTHLMIRATINTTALNQTQIETFGFAFDVGMVPWPDPTDPWDTSNNANDYITLGRFRFDADLAAPFSEMTTLACAGYETNWAYLHNGQVNISIPAPDIRLDVDSTWTNTTQNANGTITLTIVLRDTENYWKFWRPQDTFSEQTTSEFDVPMFYSVNSPVLTNYFRRDVLGYNSACVYVHTSEFNSTDDEWSCIPSGGFDIQPVSQPNTTTMTGPSTSTTEPATTTTTPQPTTTTVGPVVTKSDEEFSGKQSNGIFAASFIMFLSVVASALITVSFAKSAKNRWKVN